nr:PREDICTED: cytochrome P450 2C31 [Anolis carolinensis]XP_016851495.1 PREDICTED: cytochrome P450 2C31 [Anolis carolinensis]|eukprot:XP_003224955.1 PREDICTED: cytochrome P450 2C31 [Anolis carolinensis]
MELLGTCTALLVIWISFLLLSATWKSKMYRKGKMPPGPTPLPIFGNVLQLKGKYWDQEFSKISETYGPVFTFYLGMEPVVVLNGYEAIKEALIDQGNDFSFRAKIPLIDKLNKGGGIMFSNGKTWKQLRQFTLTTFRNFGMGKRSIEERIQKEIQYLLEQFHDTKGQPFDPHYLMINAVSSVIGSVIFGKHYGYDDKKFQTFITQIIESIEIFASICGQLFYAFPAFMEWFPGPHQHVIANYVKLKEFILEEAKEHRATLDPNSPRDFIDCFLIRMDQEKHDEASEFTMENMVTCCIDLFGAGTETTSSTLKYGLLLLQKYPEIEEKVHEEIDRVVGRSRMPGMADRRQMPYIDAVIHEIQRFMSLASVSIPHSVVKDTPFRGYVIPKGTTVFPVLISVLHDGKEFPNPTEFDPGHFLNEDGTFRKSDYFMPFSAGKRLCVGEGMARMELFLFFTSILQNFKLKPITDPKDIDVTPLEKPGGRFSPHYEFCVIPR